MSTPVFGIGSTFNGNDGAEADTLRFLRDHFELPCAAYPYGGRHRGQGLDFLTRIWRGECAAPVCPVEEAKP